MQVIDALRNLPADGGQAGPTREGHPMKKLRDLLPKRVIQPKPQQKQQPKK